MKDLCLTIILPSLQVTIPEDELDIQHLEKFVCVKFLWVVFPVAKMLLFLVDLPYRLEKTMIA